MQDEELNPEISTIKGESQLSKGRIILIIPFFGKFNNYFKLWLESAGKNPELEFLFVTDNLMQNLPSNIRVCNQDFYSLVRDIQKIVPEMNIVLDKPYKLCDFRLVFGKLFEQYIKGYEFWGYCDIDLIFGNVSNFISDYLLSICDKFCFKGHLTIFRNVDFFKNLYKCEDKRLGVTYKTAWSINYPCHFDEMEIWDNIIVESGYQCYKGINFADIRYDKKRFVMAYGNFFPDSVQIYAKERGRLFRYYLVNAEIHRQEVLFVHLRKRVMEISKIVKDDYDYLIVPNQFIPFEEVTPSLIKEYSPEEHIYIRYYASRLKMIISKLRTGVIRYRIIRLIRRFSVRGGYRNG